MISVTNVSKTFGREPVLENITFTMEQGRTACIIGRNGSGKSTLLSILGGVLLPDSGTVSYNGLPPLKSPLSLLPQGDHLFADLTVRDNLSFWAAAAGQKLQSPQVAEAITLLNITPFLNKKVKILSGGMRRRVAICNVLLSAPEYILLDEPFAGLDLLYKKEISSYLGQLGGQGKTVIYTAHNIDEIQLLAQELFVIADNHLVPVPMSQSLDTLDTTITHYLKGETNDERSK